MHYIQQEIVQFNLSHNGRSSTVHLFENVREEGGFGGQIFWPSLGAHRLTNLAWKPVYKMEIYRVDPAPQTKIFGPPSVRWYHLTQSDHILPEVVVDSVVVVVAVTGAANAVVVVV